MFEIRELPAKLVLLVLATATAVSLLYLSVPRSAAAFLTIAGDKVYDRVKIGKKLTSRQLEQFETSRHRALDWTRNAKIYEELSIAQILKRASLKGVADQRAADEETLRLTAQALALSPTGGRTWLRMAGSEARLNGDSRLLSDALTLSFLTGPVLPLRTLGRIDLALISQQFEQSADRDLIFRQMRIAWAMNPETALSFSAASPRKIALFRAALAYDSVAYDTYNRRLDEYLKRRREHRSAS